MAKAANTSRLGTDPVLGLVLRLAIPSMLAQFVNVLYGIVDRIFIGNIAGVGDVALAGAGVCGPIVTLISSFAFLVGIGGGPLLAMRLGEKNQKGAEKILANCFVMLLALAVGLTLVFLLVKDHLLMWFGASEQTFPYANTYLTIYTAGTVFAILSVGLNQFITCQGFAGTAMASVMVGAVTNIVLDPIFIFTLNMGVAGAAIATVIAQLASCTYVVIFLFSKKTHVRITFGGYDRSVMKRVITFGFSPFVIMATDSLLIIVLNSVLQRYGGDQFITCATIVQSYMLLITMPMAGITGGTQGVISYNYGAKKLDRIKQAERWIVTLCVIFTIIMFTLSQIVSGTFARIFTQNEEMIGLSQWGIRVFTMAIIPLAFQYSFVDCMTALGAAKVAVSLSLFRKTFYFLLTVLIPLGMGAAGAFYAEPIADVVAACVSSLVFSLVFRRLLRQRAEMPDGQALYT